MDKVASVVGKPIMAVKCTKVKKMMSYARVLIEMNVIQESIHPEVVTFLGEKEISVVQAGDCE